MTKVLLVGSGARENAISDALVKSGSDIFAFMSNKNPGICKYTKDYAIGNIADVEAVKKFAERAKPDFAVIGPEAPLAAGVVDALEKTGIGCFGPNKALARLETSKAFTRELMEKHKIPGSPKLRIFNKGCTESDIADFLEELGEFVVKPDGLTGGKGVKVYGEHLHSRKEAVDYCNELFSTHPSVIIEEKLEGEEFSLQSITDGKTVIDCPPVQDHKRAFENDEGPNTGGMGSYSCSDHLLPFLRKDDVEEAHDITTRVAKALSSEIGPYKGVMYGGFMLTKKGVKLIEYNARFGDPEAMNIIPLMETDFSEVCNAVLHTELHKIKIIFSKLASVCKYVVPKGYPENPEPGKISVPPSAPALTFYAAVDEKADGICTTKSRAVAFVGMSNDIKEAERIAELAASKVAGNVYHRKDIGTEQLLNKRVKHMDRLKCQS